MTEMRDNKKNLSMETPKTQQRVDRRGTPNHNPGLLLEDYLCLTHAARLVFSFRMRDSADSPGHVDRSTLFRWTTNGLKGPNNQRVLLEFCYIGTKIFTSKQALQRFFAQFNKPDSRP